MIEKIEKFLDEGKWKLCLYYDGIKIKTIRVYRNELEDLKNKRFNIKVFFKKQLFRSNIVEIIVSPVVLLNTDDDKKEISVGVVIEQGTKL